MLILIQALWEVLENCKSIKAAGVSAGSEIVFGRESLTCFGFVFFVSFHMVLVCGVPGR